MVFGRRLEAVTKPQQWSRAMTPTTKTTLSIGLFTVAAAVSLFAANPAANAATGGYGYGCFRANTAMNIRERPWASSNVIATAKAGDVVIKRKRFCNVRGYWCAITTTKGVEGYGDKSLMDKMNCP
jgi:hypothetical protein